MFFNISIFGKKTSIDGKTQKLWGGQDGNDDSNDWWLIQWRLHHIIFPLTRWFCKLKGLTPKQQSITKTRTNKKPWKLSCSQEELAVVILVDSAHTRKSSKSLDKSVGDCEKYNLDSSRTLACLARAWEPQGHLLSYGNGYYQKEHLG